MRVVDAPWCIESLMMAAMAIMWFMCWQLGAPMVPDPILESLGGWQIPRAITDIVFAGWPVALIRLSLQRQWIDKADVCIFAVFLIGTLMVRGALSALVLIVFLEATSIWVKFFLENVTNFLGKGRD